MQSVKDEASIIFYGVDQSEGYLSKFLQEEGELNSSIMSIHNSEFRDINYCCLFS